MGRRVVPGPWNGGQREQAALTVGQWLLVRGPRRQDLTDEQRVVADLVFADHLALDLQGGPLDQKRPDLGASGEGHAQVSERRDLVDRPAAGSAGDGDDRLLAHRGETDA